MAAKKEIKINLLFLAHLAENKSVKELAAFIHLKSLYKSSCIHNYTQKSLAEKSGLTVGQVRKYMKFFFRMGWCYTKYGHVWFKGMGDIDTFKKKHTKKLELTDFKTLYDDLLHLILKNKQNQFNRLKKLKSDICNPHPVVKRRAERKAGKLNIRVRSLPCAEDFLKMSMKTIAKLLGLSVGSAANFIRRLKSKGLIFCITSRKTVFSSTKAIIKANIDQFSKSYLHGNNLVVVECNKYRF